MAGIFSYVIFMSVLLVWAVGWMAIAGIVGAILKVEPKIAINSGLILGPLGVLYIIFSGVSDRVSRRQALKAASSSTSTTATEEDPFG